MGRIRTQPKTRSLDRSEVLWNNFSKEEPRVRPTLGVLFIKETVVAKAYSQKMRGMDT